MRAAVGLAVLATGCGRFAFDARSDASISDATDAAATPDAPYPTGPFSTPASVTELNTSMILDDDPNPVENQLEIFFTSSRIGTTGSCDIWTATRAATTDPWGTATSIASIVSTSCDSGPRITRDGLAMYFTSLRGTTQNEVWFTSRPSVGAAWAAPVLVPEVNSAPDSESSLSVTADGLIAVMMSTRSSGDNLFEVRRSDPTAPWGTPMLMTTLNSSSRDRSPNISPDGLVIYFASDRPGGEGNNDIYMATRASTSDPFSTPVRVPEVSTAGNEDDPWVSADGHTMMLTSTGPGGDSDIFIATR